MTGASVQSSVACPFCRSSDVELISPFGKMQLVKQYYCKQCKTVFERIKWQDVDDGAQGDPRTFR